MAVFTLALLQPSCSHIGFRMALLALGFTSGQYSNHQTKTTALGPVAGPIRKQLPNNIILLHVLFWPCFPVENAIARLLYQKIRILCIVTIEEYNDRLFKFSHFLLKDRCNQIIYFSTALIYHQSIIYVGTSKFRDGKSALITEAFLQTARNHRNTADWYLRLSLRSFIIFENMRYFLSKFYPGEPLYFGAIANDNHGDPCLCSDYILSRKTFGLLVDALSISVVKRTSDQGSCQIRPNTEGKDVLDCFNNLMIKTESSFDALGRTRFHCFHPVIEVNRDFPEVFKRTNPDYRTVSICSGPSLKLYM